MVVDFGGDGGGQLFLGEGLLVQEVFDAGERIRDLMPLVIDYLRQLLQCEDLLLWDLSIQHGDELLRALAARASILCVHFLVKYK